METIADRINEILKIKGIKKTEFAKRIRYQRFQRFYMCSGKSKPSGQTITMICREFGVNPEWLRMALEKNSLLLRPLRWI